MQLLISGSKAGKGSEVTIPEPTGDLNIEEREGLSVVKLSRLIEMKIACGLGSIRRTHKDLADVVELIAIRKLVFGDIDRVRAIVANDTEILNYYDYRNFGATPLTMACFSNHQALVEVLIELGADPNRKSDWKMGTWSPLHCSIYRHDRMLAELLLSLGATLDVHIHPCMRRR